MNSYDRQRRKMQESRSSIMGREPGEGMRWHCPVVGYHTCPEHHYALIKEIPLTARAPTKPSTRPQARALHRLTNSRGNYLSHDGEYFVRRTWLDTSIPNEHIEGYEIYKCAMPNKPHPDDPVVHVVKSYRQAKDWVAEEAPWTAPGSVYEPSIQEMIDALGKDEYWGDPVAEELYTLGQVWRSAWRENWDLTFRKAMGAEQTVFTRVREDMLLVRKVIDTEIVLIQGGMWPHRSFPDAIRRLIASGDAEAERLAFGGKTDPEWRLQKIDMETVIQIAGDHTDRNREIEVEKTKRQLHS